MALNPGLYVTATPIGNLKDITFRAVETLKAADLILCEDTRITSRLCAEYAIETTLKAYHDHNAQEVRPLVLERLAEEASIALVSDAGTPLISDPGYKLVRAVREAGHPVYTVPGASALTAALSIAGAPTDRFLFAGFLPPKSGARKSALRELAAVPATLVFYETGPRLAGCLADMAETLGDRDCAIARELSKIYEEVRDGTLAGLARHYREHGPKGEIVICVHPAPGSDMDEAAMQALLGVLFESHTVKDAVAVATQQSGWPRKRVYDLALALKTPLA